MHAEAGAIELVGGMEMGTGGREEEKGKQSHCLNFKWILEEPVHPPPPALVKDHFQS